MSSSALSCSRVRGLSRAYSCAGWCKQDGWRDISPGATPLRRARGRRTHLHLVQAVEALLRALTQQAKRDLEGVVRHFLKGQINNAI